MYLVIRVFNPSGLIVDSDNLEGFYVSSAVRASDFLKTGRFKVYKLDNLQEVKEIIVTTEDKIA